MHVEPAMWEGANPNMRGLYLSMTSQDVISVDENCPTPYQPTKDTDNNLQDDLYCIVLYLQPVLNPKSYDGARVLEASGRPMLVIGRSY